MMLADTNVWLALALSGHSHHDSARAWLDSVHAPRSIALCRMTQQSTLRLLTTSQILAPYGRPPLTNAEAWTVVDALLADDRIELIRTEPRGLDEHWHRFGVADAASPKRWMDAYLAAFAVASQRRLITFDRALPTYRGLDCMLLT